MNQLNCNVTNCAANRNHLCCRDGITVGGVDAVRPDGTCCNAFQQEVVGMTNQTMGADACPETRIKCEAAHCVYNQNYACTADSVAIRGDHAAEKYGTRCETFKAK